MVADISTTAHYTPLEALLFFQSLREQDLTRIDFAKISDGLIDLPLVKHDVSFNPTRLYPDALRKLYLDLVKEEARQDANAKASTQGLRNGSLSPGSRKRKSPSPSTPSLEAAATHRHLFPHLIYKLYARYRQQVVSTIKEEEQEIIRLEGEIARAAPTADVTTTNTKVEDKEESKAFEQTTGQQLPNGTQHDNEAVRSSNGTVAPSTRRQTTTRPTSARASIDALMNHGTPPPLSSNTAQSHSSAPSSTASKQPQSWTQDGKQAQSGHQSSPSLGQISPYTTPHVQQLPYGHGAQNHAQHAVTTQSSVSPDRPSSAVPAMAVFPSPNSGQGYAQPQRQSVPQQQPPYASPAHARSPVPGMPPIGRGYPHSPYQNYQQPYQPYPPLTQPYPPPLQQQQQQQHQQQQQTAQYQIRPSQQGGFQLPPFQVAAQDPSKVRHQYANQHTTPQRSPYAVPSGQAPPRGAHSPYSHASAFPPLTPQQSQRVPAADDDLTKSVVATLRKRRSTSTWKALGPSQISVPGSPTRPAVEPISPVRADAEPFVLSRDAKVGRGEHDADDSSKGRRGSARKSGRKARGNSVASSVIASSTRGRTRSQSVLSATANDAAGTATRSSRRVKNERASTPGDHDAKDRETPQARTGRPRRGTVQNASTTTASRQQYQQRPRERRDMVYATRNFARLSSVILNEILAHRHAGPFAKPVSDRDVEGYTDMIRRPQDLKSIKAAVTAGGRAVTAATKALVEGAEGDENGVPDPTAETPGNNDADRASGGGDAEKDASLIVLPKTLALVPPRGIVNSAQLEKEVMRTFANAVMFNRGHDGIVRDARDMAEDIAVRMGEWRGIEAQRGQGGVAAGGGGSYAEDEDGGAGGKRRRL